MSNRNQPDLHDAIKLILEGCPSKTATIEMIYQMNIDQDLYRRPKDDKYPPKHQIRARAVNYSHMFEFVETDKISLL
ncbi:MAG: hypothetical protein CVV24_09585 [Ignavibacteriae bacterium HGW-Ignavibacteriae-3]|nr:MAG: hypothetical protein CVV24_09585 [Ignavibacteriae bacterium HGW-Ignavibacteriae-3]